MPMTQKKENSTKSLNGEFRAEEIFSDILIFSKLQINRFNFVESLLLLQLQENLLVTL